MGKKSREKRERRETLLRQGYGGQEGEMPKEKETLSGQKRPFLVNFIFFGVLLALFTPLIINTKFYFPFVGPKSLYFMAICQIIFFAWLILILNNRKYRPKLNSILIAFILFLIVLILSSVLGVDFSRSFWSKYERMTGLLMWFHLFGFFLVISSTFKKLSDWKKIFIISTFVAIIISFIALLEIAGVESFKFSDRGGTTLGNTSFLGTYLLFNAFLAVWLFFQKRHWGWKIYSLGGAILMFLVIYLAGARAATLSALGGLALIFLLWLSFRPQNKRIRFLGKATLIISSLVVLIGLTLLFIPETFINQKFIEITTQSRFVNWEMAQKGFLEKPLLGWGPENYTLTFTKFFNPCLFIGECGGEIWFDRSHNIIFDTLVMTGIFGLLTYLGLFAGFFYVLGRKYFKEKSLDFWTFSIFPAVLISYFIQNLTVFDMVTSLMMFVLVLGFGGFLANIGREIKKKKERKFVRKHQWPAALLVLIFLFTFFQFVIQPLRTDYLVIKALRAGDSSQRVNLYQKTLETSPLGKYQIREFFAQQSQNIIQNNIEKMPEEDIKNELDFLIKKLEKTKKESPLDFRTILRLAHLYTLYILIDTTKIPLAENYAQETISLSPDNQQGYWVLAQVKLYQRDFKSALELAQKAIDLEPKNLQSHKIGIQIAQISNNIEKAKEMAQEAVEINPQWKKEFEALLDLN